MLKPNATKSLTKNRLAFQRAVIKWFRDEGKSYPWRETTDPYKILVSEIMLQQTTLAAVIANRRFEKFLHAFPDIATLASAKEEEVLSAWEGLGYYRRARNLQACAKAIIDQYNGQFPIAHEEILNLPGVGRYTAGAVASFAYDHSEPIVDANIARVLSRLSNSDIEVDSPKGQRYLWQCATELVPKKDARLYNSGLMELGQTLCSHRAPDCMNCPVHVFCQAPEPEELPKKKPKKKIHHVEEHALFVRRGDGDTLMALQKGSRRHGLWMLPLRAKDACADFPVIHQSKYGITHYRVNLTIYQCPATAVEAVSNSDIDEQWLTAQELIKAPLPSPFRKAIDAIEKNKKEADS